jgi:DNA-binding CsgD family transcriptional regulator
MYLSKVEEFARYLMTRELSVNDVCKFLFLHTFSELKPTAIYVGEVTIDGFIAPVGFFGLSTEMMGEGGKTPLKIGVPNTEAVKNNLIVLIKRSEAFEKYPALGRCELLPRQWDSYIACPMSPYGVIALTLDSVPEVDQGFESFIRAIGALVASNFQQRQFATERTPIRFARNRTKNADSLSERQLLIKKLIEKGHSNPAIAEEIGFSESLVRQETMAIYATLNISGRKDLLEGLAE